MSHNYVYLFAFIAIRIWQMWIGVFLSTLILFLFSNVYSMSTDGRITIYNENLGLSFLVLGASYAIYSLKKYIISKKMLWSCTVGRVNSVERTKTVFGNDLLILTYDYTVDDVAYFNDKFDFTSKEVKPSKVKMNLHIKDFSSLKDLEGEMVKVYYNAKSPWESVISRKGHVSSMMTLLPSLVIVSYFFYAALMVVGYI